MLDRRKFVAASLSGAALASFVPAAAWGAADTEKRFVFLIQRGAADGLATLAPTGDPDFLRARGGMATEALAGNKLDSFFTLHANMPEAAKLFAQRQASFVHAVASGYRERSHFDGQNILESGGNRPYARKDGWMNRLLTLLPEGRTKAIAVAPSVPLALRGAVPVSSYEQSRLAAPKEDLMRRVEMLYAEDPQLATLWEDAIRTDMMAGKPKGPQRGGAAAGKMAAGLMRGGDGARVLMLESAGWDTHSAQRGRLGGRLKQLDAFIAALHTELGAHWKNTLLIVATEFGRTVAFNGTQGTDHGTASAAMMFGGGLNRPGKVRADWPGLAAPRLLDGRDLAPTARFEDMVAGALAHHYRLERARVRRTLFPDFT
ncbi:MAG: DUF1501 domain-containing protein [Sphingorhabdus sp.]